ncbi:hypothetical protein [Goodfellowiella coeruleoviolacea]|uniref:YbjN domain-containing protein n=1 Tax=Goodfellowiella coeruleoviolacea TaxID=334858 RepID=A0AAE3KGT8_9PSEU|nr:hypothetical protein [Goodfellowiella coeruleoviolacea]MCP2166565.1 hypothetical protein [Goodfellowiella coeruleoviolacea]
MATWRDLVAFVKSEYQVIKEEADEIRLLFEFDDERSQVIVLAREVLDNRYEWVQIASPIGLVSRVDLAAFLAEVGRSTVAGGAAVMGEHLVIRHSLPLENLDINEFVDPLSLIAGSADLLEEQFFGRDDY